MNIKDLLKKKNIETNNDYSFLDSVEDNLLLLTLGGSHAYGTNVESSDVDIRGVSMNTPKEILLNRDHEETINEKTDTVIYTINKYIKLLLSCNPNTIELIGSLDRNALYLHPYFKEKIINNLQLFLSKRAFYSFGGYARAQLNRLNNKLGRTIGEIEAQNIMRSISNARVHFKEHYDLEFGKDIDISVDGVKFGLNIPDLSKEQMQACLNEISSILRDYNKLGKRNQSAIEHNKLSKHAMHLIRLYMMAIDILEKGEVNTYREKEHDLLMSIRNNENNIWFSEDSGMTSKMSVLVNHYNMLLSNAFENSKLPDNPNIVLVEDLIIEINNDIVKEKWSAYE